MTMRSAASRAWLRVSATIRAIGLAGVADDVLGEERLRQEAERLVGLDVGLDGGPQWAEPIGGGIARGEDGEHARACQSVGRVDGGHACVRMRRPNEDGVSDVIEPQII